MLWINLKKKSYQQKNSQVINIINNEKPKKSKKIDK